VKRLKLAIVASHPIQYQAHWFCALAKCPDLDFEVFFCHRAGPQEQAAAGFGVGFDWDVPLLNGYKHRFLRNVAARPSLGSFSGLDTPELRQIIVSGQFDAIIVSGWYFKSAWQAIRACWEAGTPVMVRGDSHLHSPRNIAKNLLKAIPYRWFVPKFDACLAVGEWSADYFRRYGARQERIFSVPHSIDGERFQSEWSRLEPLRSELRRQWSLTADSVVFLLAGKLIGRKRPLDFVQAVHRAACRGLRIEGLVVGDGPLRQECEQFAIGSGAPVRFAGFLNQSQIASAYVASDVLVLPSEGSETWGLVANEAMTCGRPCIVSDRVGCGPDLVTPGVTGYVFPVGDIESLADVMARCAADRPSLARMGACARNRVARYSTAAAVEGVLRAVDAVRGKAGGIRV
jgi:glycosyltransferase involved in cell wall biosynthesis